MGLRDEHPSWGGRKLHHRLLATGVADVPAPSTITAILRRHGLLAPEPTMVKRLTRAKQKIRQARIPYRVPADHELPDRLAGVAATVYLLFNEGYSATGGDDPIRADLVDEAMRLGRLLAGLLPDEPAVLGLLALMLLQDARRPARFADDGLPVLLADQDRRRWRHDQAQEGVVLVGEGLRRTPGRPDPYVVQAAIAACHALAPASRPPTGTPWSPCTTSSSPSRTRP